MQKIGFIKVLEVINSLPLTDIKIFVVQQKSSNPSQNENSDYKFMYAGFLNLRDNAVNSPGQNLPPSQFSGRYTNR